MTSTSRRTLVVMALLMLAMAAVGVGAAEEQFGTTGQAAEAVDLQDRADADENVIDDDEEDIGAGAEDEMELDDDAEGFQERMLLSGTIFHGHDLTSPVFHAGDEVRSSVVFSNQQQGSAHHIFFVMGYLSRIGEQSPFQNFSGVRHNHAVHYGESVTMQYHFKPDAQLVPMDYMLVVRVFFRDEASNETYASVAYNATVKIAEPSTSDPHLLLTFLTVVAAAAGGIYYSGRHTSSKRKRDKPVAAAAKAKVEMGTNGVDYDPEYVSVEHLKYREALLRNKSSSPPRKTSASPKKH